MGNLEYVMGLVYKMLNSKELGVIIDQVEDLTLPIEAREEPRQEDIEETR